MRRFLFTVALALGMVATTALPVAAITGGQPDGDGHPYGALLLVPGVTFCSGTLIDEDVILTAGHCTDFWSNTGDPDLTIDEVLVSFEPRPKSTPTGTRSTPKTGTSRRRGRPTRSTFPTTGRSRSTTASSTSTRT